MLKKILFFALINFVDCYALQLFLKTANLSSDQLIKYDVESTSVRTNGIRLEAERIENKLIIHNYGYGKDGLCLAWGGAQEAVRLMESLSRYSLPKNNPIAIIGAGVVGLSVAQALLDQGYKVVVYAQDLPPHTDSSSLYGMFDVQALPCDSLFHKNRMERIKNVSWNKLQELAQERSGVRKIDCFDFNQIPKPAGQLVDLILGADLKRKAIQQKTFVINGALFVPLFFESLKTRGVKCEQRSFNQLQDFAELPEIVIFNCTGFGARQLCNDAQLQRTQLPIISFKNSSDIDYALINNCKETSISCAMVPGDDCIIIRGSLASGHEIAGGNEQIYQKMLELMRFEMAHNNSMQKEEVKEAVWVSDTINKPTVKMYEESLSFALKKLNCKGDERILLWGCNSDAICDQLITKVPQGSIVAVDRISRLVQESKNKFSNASNISFQTRDVKIQEFQMYDYVVSLMGMHMPLDQSVYDSFYLSLKQKGGLLLMIPINNQHHFYTCLRAGIKYMHVPRSFDESKNQFNVLEPQEIKVMLTNAGFKSIMMSESSCPLQFASNSSFYDWIYQCMGSLECLKEFNEETKKLFFANVVDQYLGRYVGSVHNNLRYDMPFVLVYAQK